MLVPTQQILKGGSGPSIGEGTSHDGRSPRNAATAAKAEREKLEAGRRALKELLKNRGKKNKKKANCKDILKLYITIAGGLMLVLGLLVFLFLVPMTIDPALVTITFEITPEPVMCMTTSYIVTEGLSNTTWCSCLEGCTADVFTCYQITVAYKKINLSSSPSAGRIKKRSINEQRTYLPSETSVAITEPQYNSNELFSLHRPPEVAVSSSIKPFDDSSTQQLQFTDKRHDTLANTAPSFEVIQKSSFISDDDDGHYINSMTPDMPFGQLPEDILEDFDNFISDPEDETRKRYKRETFTDDSFWDVTNASLFVNVKGCGYPPMVNCSRFEIKYGKVGRKFYCHYSQVNNSIVLDKYDRQEALEQLYLSFGVTLGIVFLGGVIIVIMKFPFRKTFCRIKKKRKVAQTPMSSR